MAKIGINGFGRIGRVFLRCCVEKGSEVVAINTRNGAPRYLAHVFKHDSTHGKFNAKISYDDKNLIINKVKIAVFNYSDPKKIPWKPAGVQYVVESTGQFTTKAKASGHLTGGAKKVIITAPSKDAPMYVIGVNACSYDPKEKVISMASCTTNCLAPLAKVIHDTYGIEEGLMTTVHAATLSQKVLDAANDKKWRTVRSAMANIIPGTTGAARAVGRVIPELDGKLTGMAFRVPVVNVSVVDLTVRLRKPTEYDEIKCTVREASLSSLFGVLGYSEEELVSTDLIGSAYSSIFDARAGMALSEKFVKLISWYDNEWGYSQRLVELAEFMYKRDTQKECKK